MEKKRPIGVTILAVLAALGAIATIIHTLQMLHLWPITVGEIRFFTFDLLGAILWGILALIYIWVVRMLWNLDPQGWLFLVILSILNLILAIVSILGQTMWQDMLWAIVVNVIILVYCLLPGTKEAFGADTLKDVSTEPPPPPSPPEPPSPPPPPAPPADEPADEETEQE